MKLVLDKCYLQLDKKDSTVYIKGYVCGNGSICTLQIDLKEERYNFKLELPKFRQLLKEFKGEYFHTMGRKALDGELYVSLTETLEPRRVTIESIKEKSPDNGDAINNGMIGLCNMFKRATYLGEYRVEG